MKRTKLFPPLLVILFLLQACLPTTQIEETAIINTRGVDLINEGGKRMVETTVVPFFFDPEAQESTSILIGKGRTIKEAREDAGKQSSYLLSPGKISLELYGKEAAETGILPLMNTLVRDARVSERMIIAVTNQTAKELLETEQKTVTANKVEFMQDLIKKETEQFKLPESELQYFARYVEHVGIDPILPVMDLKDDRPLLIGAAAFNRDRYVLGISLEESFLINQMRRKVKKTPIDAKVPTENYQDQIAYQEESTKNEDSIYVSLHLKQGKGKIKIIDEETLAFKAEIKMQAELLETSIPMDIKTEAVAKKLEKDLETYYKEKYEELFSKLQEVKSDAFGIGKKYVSTRKDSKTTKKEWKDKYPDVTVEFKVDFTLSNFGIIN